MIRDLDLATWASGPLNSQLHQGLPDKGANLYLKKRFFKQTCSHISPKIVSCHQQRLRATLVKVISEGWQFGATEKGKAVNQAHTNQHWEMVLTH